MVVADIEEARAARTARLEKTPAREMSTVGRPITTTGG
jgi:hypothetical protein